MAGIDVRYEMGKPSDPAFIKRVQQAIDDFRKAGYKADPISVEPLKPFQNDDRNVMVTLSPMRKDDVIPVFFRASNNPLNWCRGKLFYNLGWSGSCRTADGVVWFFGCNRVQSDLEKEI